MALPHGTKLGPYEVIGPLGSGGMGEVHRARDTRLGRDIALKVLPVDRLADPARRARFEQEARAVARLNHPHIVTIHEIEQAERIILRCLHKEPERRFQHMTDLKVELEEIKEESASRTSAPAGVVARPFRRVWRRSLPLLAVGALVVSSLIGLGVWWRFRTVPAPVLRSVIKLEPGYWLDGQRTISPWGFEQPTRTAIALSSEGRFLVYSAIRENPGPQMRPQLYMRRTDQLEARPIAGTEGGISPFLSPDDRWVGFWADGKLMKAPVNGGVPVTLCDAEMIFGASWGPEGTIVFSPSLGSGLLKVPADGGKPETLTTPDKAREEASHRLPHWLADGKGVLFTIMREPYDLEPRVALLDLKAQTWRVVVEDGADGRYVPTGHLVFLRRGSLMAVPFDAARGRPAGQAVPAVAGLAQTLNRLNPFENTAAGQLGVSDSGSLVYAPGGILPDIDSRLVWLDQRGNEQPTASVKAFFFSPRLSPDGRRIAYTTLGMGSGLGSTTSTGGRQVR